MSSLHGGETLPLSSATRDENAQLASLSQTESPPVMKKQAGHAPFASEVPEDLNKIRITLSLEMTGHWVGPMPVNDFLDEFLSVASASGQCPSLPKDPFQQMLSQSSESNRYTPFIRAIEGWMPGFVAVDAGNRADAAKKLKPDVSLYRAGDQVHSGTNFSQMELWVEFKGNTSELPFQDHPEQPSAGASDEQTTFTPETKRARGARGQLISYAVTHHARQFRHFSFSIFIADNHVRFLRWDQAGTIVTAAFDFHEHPDIMASFLWRFSHLSDAQRGYDMSVRPADLTSDVARRIRKGLALDSAETPLFEYDLPGLSGKGRGYGPSPPPSSDPLVARCTRGLPIFFIPHQGPQYENVTTHAEPGIPPGSEEASPWEKEGVVYLKDAWLFLSNNPNTNLKMMREHEIYELLHEKKTPNIPKHVAGGDVPGGMTQTQNFRDADWLCVTVTVKPFQHYRLVLGVVGRPLTKFKCTKELVQAIYDAMQAHWYAYEIVLILHRDISVGNILITNDGHGLLIDWEMGKLRDEVGAQQYDRAGTMQFMSAALLRDPRKMHTLSDDIESFIHVIGWLIIRLVPSTERFCPGLRVYSMKMFNGANYRVIGHIYGGGVKASVLGAGMYPAHDFEFKQSTPLSHLLSTLCKPFKMWYSQDPPTDEDRFKLSEPTSTLEDKRELMRLQFRIEDYDEAVERLKSSTWFIGTIGAALAEAGWPEDDAADETVYPPSSELMTEFQEQPRTSRLLTSQNRFANSKGSSGGSTRKRRASSLTPEPSAKRHRGC